MAKRGRVPPMITNVKSQPCKGCTKRHPKCHVDCPEYADMKAEIAAFRAMQAEYDINNAVTAGSKKVSLNKDKTKGVTNYK